MAATYTPQQAFDYARRMIGNLPLEDSEIKLAVLNDAAHYLHLYAPWSWTVGAFDPVTLVTGQDDYALVDPADVMHPLRGDVFDVNNERLDRHLWPAHSLPADDSIKGRTANFELTSTTNVRFFPTPSGEVANTKVRILYRKQLTEITEGNIGVAATLDFPDQWHWLYKQLVLFEARRFEQGTPNGSVQVATNGSVAYSGDYADREAMMMYMKAREKPLKIDTGENQGL